ncbi:MAG: inositol-3-phosphate synthase [Thaumarchaeota archaeon]|nr:inositol-3-phosphate synthase [Nitrososphaerota archaeon]
MKEIRVAIAGVGSCSAALVQGWQYYRQTGDSSDVLGLMHPVMGGYHVGDIKFVAAFDVNQKKLGRDLSEAVFTEPNDCIKFSDVDRVGVEVMPGPILDGVAPHMKEPFNAYEESKVKPVDVAKVLRDVGADILMNYLPVGSKLGTRHYAEACLKAGCALVNCIPEFIASDKAWATKFKDAKLPVAGDDIKSQVGATILHRTLVSLFQQRGVKVDKTYQLNLGGNTDFLNMTSEKRLSSKRISKTEAVTSLIPYSVPTRIGPSDYVPFLGDRKICYIYLKGSKFGGVPIEVEVKLTVEDSPNSAGVAVDVIRATKIALDRGVAGPLESISSYCFKHPPVTVSDDVARKWVEEYVEGVRER